MHYLPIKTRVMQPPQDNIYALVDESLGILEEGDVLLITSKIVAIHEGRCIKIGDEEKNKLIENEADMLCKVEGRTYPITVVHHALISSAGIDESNGSGYYTLLPKDPFGSAQKIHRYIKEKFNLQNIGVIITDSHSSPFRYGATSIAIGCWGIRPVESHIGKLDIFGRRIQYAKTNIVDSLSAGSTLVSGECAEMHPFVIVRDVPNLTYTEEHPEAFLTVPYEKDLFAPLFKDFIRRKK